MRRVTRMIAAISMAMFTATLAHAQKAPIKIGTALDFTKVYTFLTSEYSQGQRDYIALLNARGGIDGSPVEIDVVDHGNEPQRGIEAYERFKNNGAVLMDFLSTPVSRAIVPRALADGMNVITAFHGRSDAADGTVFPTIFPMTPAYWSQATGVVAYINGKAGSLKGKKVAYVHIDSPFGKEPAPVFQKLSETLGYTLLDFAYPSPGNEQSTVWTQVRRERPDWVVLWGAGGGQPNSVREALRNGISPDRIVSVIWLSETDMTLVGADQAKGISRFEGVAPGNDLPIIKAIQGEVIAKGNGSGDPARIGTTYYNVGVATMALFAEGARIAIKQDGAPLTSAKLKKGFEQIKDFTAEGLIGSTTVTAEDHQGGGRGRIASWDGKTWKPQGEWTAAYQDIVQGLVKKTSAEFKASGK